MADAANGKRIVYVTPTQIAAAKLNVKMRRELGEPVPAAMEAIANAKRQSAPAESQARAS
jgi:hypothetical protein